MSMTRIEKYAKIEIMDILRDEGYPTYASILKDFDVHITNDPGVAAYLDPAAGEIVFNAGLDIDQVCVIARHEILHHFLKHEKRLLDKLAREHGLDPDEADLDELTLKELKDELYQDSIFNIAADYEISNRGYTEEDKKIVRELKLNGEVVSGLVTEDQHPEWINYSVEEMFDELRKMRNETQPDDNVINGVLVNDENFAGADGVMYGI